MKTYLLPDAGTFYKANLHSHSSFSDGRLKPEEMKETYKNHGYSVLAISDHDALHSHFALSEPDFLVMTAYEISIRSDDMGYPHAYRKVVDLNLLAKRPDNLIQCGYHPETVQWLVDRGKMTKEDVAAIRYAGELRDLHYYPSNINKIIKSANEAGFLVTINHPMWSLMNFNDYGTFEGAWAVEVYNHGCASQSGLSDSEGVYDDILRTGKKIFALATDDNHNGPALSAWNSDSFGGFIMVKAEALSYSAVIEALENGHFYASTGPEIHELFYEDGYVHIETSQVRDICMTTLGRRGERKASADGSLITSASFKIDADLYGFVRFRVTDAQGRKAWSNPYYVDEFMPEAPCHRVVF